MEASRSSAAAAGPGPAAHAAPEPGPAGAAPATGPPDDFAPLGASAEDLPVLHAPGAWPLVRDRWERLVTSTIVPAEPAEVWRALVDPEALRLWLARCHGSPDATGRDCVLDFEDGEFFLVRPQSVTSPEGNGTGSYELRWLWRWLGIGQATSVTWSVAPADGGSVVVVTEDATNPPRDWQTWNGGGWPGILEQLAAYLRTGLEWRWPWRRMGPYVQVELAAPPFEAWDQLMGDAAIKFWLQRMSGSVGEGETLELMMGDASGTVDMAVREVVDAGQQAPSFLPHVDFALRRPTWGNDVGGRLWIEPAGWGRSLFQVFHYNWEGLPAELQLSERKLLTSFWAGAMRRATMLFLRPDGAGGPHSWT